jgi:hypothetical protein
LQLVIRFKGTTVLLLLAALAAAAAASTGYWYLLETELAGYRGVKAAQLEQNQARERRRKAIAGFPATRERLLKEEFGDLPEGPDIHTDLRLLNIWQHLLLVMFAVVATGVSFYAAFWRRKALWRRLAIAVLALAGAGQALPMLLLPTDALKLFQRFGIWVVVAAAFGLALDSAADRLMRRGAAKATEVVDG